MKTTLIYFAAAVAFAFIYELVALPAGGPVPISNAIWHLSESWDFFGPLCGLISGGLFVHFFWIPKCRRCGYHPKQKESNEL